MEAKDSARGSGLNEHENQEFGGRNTSSFVFDCELNPLSQGFNEEGKGTNHPSNKSSVASSNEGTGQSWPKQSPRNNIIDLSSQELTDLEDLVVPAGQPTILLAQDNSIKKIELPPSSLGIIIKINLDSNLIEKLPGFLAQMASLRELSVANNRIKEIAQEFVHRRNFVLKHLNLSRNFISKVPGGISNLKGLEHLSLFGNEITEIPVTLLDLQSLKILEIEWPEYLAQNKSSVLQSKNLERLFEVLREQRRDSKDTLNFNEFLLRMKSPQKQKSLNFFENDIERAHCFCLKAIEKRHTAVFFEFIRVFPLVLDPNTRHGRNEWSKGAQMLHSAFEHNCPKVANYLLTIGVTPKNLESLLFWSVAHLNFCLLSLVLSKGGSVNSVPREEESSLLISCVQRCFENNVSALKIMDFLMKQGADPLWRDTTGKTAIHYAVEKGELAAYKVLKGFVFKSQMDELTAQDAKTHKNTLLILSAGSENIDMIVEMLRERPHDDLLENNKGETALDCVPKYFLTSKKLIHRSYRLRVNSFKKPRRARIQALKEFFDEKHKGVGSSSKKNGYSPLSDSGSSQPFILESLPKPSLFSRIQESLFYSPRPNEKDKEPIGPRIGPELNPLQSQRLDAGNEDVSEHHSEGSKEEEDLSEPKEKAIPKEKNDLRERIFDLKLKTGKRVEPLSSFNSLRGVQVINKLLNEAVNALTRPQFGSPRETKKLIDFTRTVKCHQVLNDFLLPEPKIDFEKYEGEFRKISRGQSTISIWSDSLFRNFFHQHFWLESTLHTVSLLFASDGPSQVLRNFYQKDFEALVPNQEQSKKAKWFIPTTYDLVGSFYLKELKKTERRLKRRSQETDKKNSASKKEGVSGFEERLLQIKSIQFLCAFPFKNGKLNKIKEETTWELAGKRLGLLLDLEIANAVVLRESEKNLQKAWVLMSDEQLMRTKGNSK